MNEKQMQDMAVSILLDEYTQLDVAQLLKEYDEAEENGEVPNTPDTLDEACNRMIQREFAQKKQKKFFVGISKVLSRVAMVTLMLIGLCTVSVLSVKAWREPALRFVLEILDRRSSASIEGEVSQESKTPEDVIERLAEIIPAGYALAQKDVRDGYYQVMYAGSLGQNIVLIITEQESEIYFDTENSEWTKTEVNGCEIVFANKNGYKIIWLEEDCELLIELSTVNIGERDFWKIVNMLVK